MQYGYQQGVACSLTCTCMRRNDLSFNTSLLHPHSSAHHLFSFGNTSR